MKKKRPMLSETSQANPSEIVEISIIIQDKQIHSHGKGTGPLLTCIKLYVVHIVIFVFPS